MSLDPCSLARLNSQASLNSIKQPKPNTSTQPARTSHANALGPSRLGDTSRTHPVVKERSDPCQVAWRKFTALMKL